MSQAHVEQFANRVANDPAMFKKLVAGTQTPEQFIEKAIALGGETGFVFTKEEAEGWVQKQIKAKQDGELSDMQLEGVAGGKSRAQDHMWMEQNMPGVTNAFGWFGANVVAPVENWLNSW